LTPNAKTLRVGAEFYIKTLVKEGASLGANSTVVCGHTIGKYAFVGAGALVTKDVPGYAFVIGNHGKVVGWVSEAGKKLVFDKDGLAFCQKSGKKYKLENNTITEIE